MHMLIHFTKNVYLYLRIFSCSLSQLRTHLCKVKSKNEMGTITIWWLEIFVQKIFFHQTAPSHRELTYLIILLWTFCYFLQFFSICIQGRRVQGHVPISEQKPGSANLADYWRIKRSLTHWIIFLGTLCHRKCHKGWYDAVWKTRDLMFRDDTSTIQFKIQAGAQFWKAKWRIDKGIALLFLRMLARRNCILAIIHNIGLLS
jgi:hypothetical protein